MTMLFGDFRAECEIDSIEFTVQRENSADNSTMYAVVNKADLTEFIKEVSKRTNYTQSAIGEVFAAARELLIEELAKGEEVSFIKGVTFFGKQREEKVRYNPLLKKDITISAAILPKARFAESFKDAMNN